MNARETVFLLAPALVLASACSNGGGGGGNDPDTFSIMFEAPNGSGLASGELHDLEYDPVILENFILPVGLTLNGVVTDENGAPVEGAEVWFRNGADDPAMAEAQTDVNGAYSVVMPAGDWRVEVESPDDEVGTYVDRNYMISGPGPVTADFQFVMRVAVTGVVTEEFGPGIAGAELKFTGEETGSEVEVVADGTGAYSAMLVPDTYTVEVKPEGASEDTHLGERFEGNRVSGATAFDFALEAGVVVSGTVLGSDGLPLLEEIEIDVVLSENSPYLRPDDTDSDSDDGTFSIGPVPAGSVTFRLEPDEDDVAYPEQDQTVLLAGPAQLVDFQLDPGYLLSGVLLAEGGGPLDEVEVEAFPVGGSPAPEDVESDEFGNYSLRLLPGQYTVRFSPDTDDLQLPEERSVTVAMDMTLSFNFVQGVKVSGTVTEPGGLTDADDVRVEVEGVFGAYDVTNEDGDYEFLVPAGTYDVTFTAEDGVLEDFALADSDDVVVAGPGTTTLDVELSLALTGSVVVSGVVYESDGTTPVVGSVIMAYDEDGEVIGRAVSLAGGLYTLVLP